MDSQFSDIFREKELFSPLPMKKTQSMQNSQISITSSDSKFQSPMRRTTILQNNNNSSYLSTTSSSPSIEQSFCYNSPKKSTSRDLTFMNMSQSSIEDNQSFKSSSTHSDEMIEEVSRLRTSTMGKDRMFESSLNKNQQFNLQQQDVNNCDLDDIMKSIEQELNFDN